jgi:hypothetical protein
MFVLSFLIWKFETVSDGRMYAPVNEQPGTRAGQ